MNNNIPAGMGTKLKNFLPNAMYVIASAKIPAALEVITSHLLGLLLKNDSFVLIAKRIIISDNTDSKNHAVLNRSGLALTTKSSGSISARSKNVLISPKYTMNFDMNFMFHRLGFFSKLLSTLSVDMLKLGTSLTKLLRSICAGRRGRKGIKMEDIATVTIFP